MSARIGLGILDGYAVRWSRETVVRDVVQNFFDEVEDFDDVVIDVDDARERVHVEGPSTVALDYLRYLGATTKADPARRSAGGFGEGFKICALVLLRDYGVEVSAGSGSYRLRAELEPVKLGRELSFQVDDAAPLAGSFVTLERADAKLRDAFRKARELFRWPGNPRLAKPIAVDDASGVGVYEALDPRRGELFYRRQLRGRARFDRGGALVLCHDGRIDALDGDRDRRDLRALDPVLRAIAAALPDDVLLALVVRLRRYWERGHRVLGALAREGARRGLRLEAPARWLAKGARTGYGLALHAARRGYRVARPELAGLGMPTIAAVLGDGEPRAPTALEHARFELARRAYAALTGAPPPGKRPLRVIDAGDVESAFRADRQAIVLASHLGGSFETGIVPCLAALARGGFARQATEGDRLTAILEGVLARPSALEGYAEAWAAAERDAPAPPLDDDDDDAYERRGTVYCAVLAPPGLPPAAQLEARVTALARAHGIAIRWMSHAVCGPNGAASQAAHGIPTLTIGARVVGAPKRARLGYYAAPRDAPDDAEILEALRESEASQLARRGGNGADPWSARLMRARERVDRRRRATDPAYARRHARDSAMTKALAAHREHPEHDALWGAAFALVRRAPEERDVAAAVAQALAEASQLARELGAIRRAERFGVNAAEAARQRFTGAIAEGRDPLAEVRAWAPAWRALEERVEAAHIDEHCGRAAFMHACLCLDGLGAPGEADVARALAALDDALELVRERHAARDEWGEPLSCYGTSQALAERRGVEGVASREARVRAVVESAWRTALEAGGTERDALEAALAAALPFDIERY